MQSDLSSILVPENTQLVFVWTYLIIFLTTPTACCFAFSDDNIHSIEDVRREVKILKALAGNKNLVQFYDAYEDNDNVYIVME